ncbi:MAG: hypothetical protein WEC00_03180 [Dongiaceae bacterium]
MRAPLRVLGFVSAATIHLAALLPSAVGDDHALIDIELGAATFAVPLDWIDPGYRDAAQAGAIDTILLVPPLDELADLVESGFDPDGVESVAILLRDDPDLHWRALYVDERIAAAEERFGTPTAEDAALAFDALPFDRLFGRTFASSGKSASRALHFVGSIPTSAHNTVAVAARIDGDAHIKDAGRLYSISATIQAGDRSDAPLALVITLRTTRALNAGDFVLIGVAISLVNSSVAD